MCQNVVQTAKENHVNIKFLTRYDSVEGTHSGTIVGDAYCRASRKCLKNLSLNDIADLCYQSDANGLNVFYIVWD